MIGGAFSAGELASRVALARARRHRALCVVGARASVPENRGVCDPSTPGSLREPFAPSTYAQEDGARAGGRSPPEGIGAEPSRAELLEALGSLSLRDVAWVGEGGIGLRETGRLLGAEHDAVVLDLRERFDGAALGAAHGAVRAGGVLVLRVPEGAWPGRLGARAARILARCSESAAELPAEMPPLPSDPDGTEEQRGAVEQLVRMIDASRPEPVALVADRGRGKSAALGMAAAHALARGLDVRVIAPHRRSIEALVRFAERGAMGLDRAMLERRLRYVGPSPPARLDRDPHVLWLADEAAALPVGTLRALARMPRVAFATTVHGYEGTGRGFTERFLGSLARLRPNAVVIRLSEPIRWAAGDPLERMTFELLLLDARCAPDGEVLAATTSSVERVILDRDALAADEERLVELLGLFVSAHYRTGPRDLATLLDAPGVEAHALLHGGRPVAAAWTSLEGGLPDDTIEAMRLGRARPLGHALPETLVAHARHLEAGRLRGARVVRIAVHPGLRRRGLGLHLLESIVERARASSLDWTGAMFGATPELLAFWQRAGFSAVRLSVSRGAASGEHSAVVLRASSQAGTRLFASVRAGFVEDLPHQLADPLRMLDPDVAAAALRGAAWREPRLGDRELEQLAAYAFGGLPYGVAARAMFELVAATVHAPGVDDAARRTLVLKVLERRDWDDVVEALGVDGASNAMRAVRRALRALLLAHGGERVRELAATFRAGEP